MAELKPKQLEAIALLAAGETVSETARQLGIGRSTIHAWHNSQTFRDTLNEAVATVADTLLAKTIALAPTAIDTLHEVMTSPAASNTDRVRAANSILQRLPEHHIRQQANHAPIEATDAAWTIEELVGDDPTAQRLLAGVMGRNLKHKINGTTEPEPKPEPVTPKPTPLPAHNADDDELQELVAQGAERAAQTVTQEPERPLFRGSTLGNPDHEYGH